MTTVFDIATEFIERSGGSIESVKLQKLCFYAFGWYAHLTGEPLFGETFYAMQKGPVVSELLSAHAGCRRVDAAMMDMQREVRDDEREGLDSYRAAIIDSTWAAYGGMSSWDLVDLTHLESIWQDAWTARRDGTQRGDLAKRDVIEYFVTRVPKPEERLHLPPAMVTRASVADLAKVESESQVHRPFVDAVRAFSLAP